MTIPEPFSPWELPYPEASSDPNMPSLYQLYQAAEDAADTDYRADDLVLRRRAGKPLTEVAWVLIGDMLRANLPHHER